MFSNTDVGRDNLLRMCLHGLTQNANESLNNVNWTHCPKRVYVGRNVVADGGWKRNFWERIGDF